MHKLKNFIAYVVFFAIAMCWGLLLIYLLLKGLTYLDGGYTQRLILNSRDSLWFQSFVIFFVLKFLCPWSWNQGVSLRLKLGIF